MKKAAQSIKITLEFGPEFVKFIDARVAEMQKDMPHFPITRTAIVRMFLGNGAERLSPGVKIPAQLD